MFLEKTRHSVLKTPYRRRRGLFFEKFHTLMEAYYLKRA